jgi:hypothetical protein
LKSLAGFSNAPPARAKPWLPARNWPIFARFFYRQRGFNRVRAVILSLNFSVRTHEI